MQLSQVTSGKFIDMFDYETSGEGPAVLLIMGLGLPGDAWWRTVPVLARSLQVITFDNRGSGRSERPSGPLTIAAMAADAVSVLDAAGIARAHVYGISMGGMIAQELALGFPDRVASLVLGATSAGGRLATPPDPATLAFLARRAGIPDEEGRWASVPYVYSERTRGLGAARIGEDFAHRRSYVFQVAGYRAQLAAAAGHNTAARVGSIGAPTLVVHGVEDRMVPPANGRALAGAIPGARFVELDDAAHLYTTDSPEADEAVREFLGG